MPVNLLWLRQEEMDELPSNLYTYYPSTADNPLGMGRYGSHKHFFLSTCAPNTHISHLLLANWYGMMQHFIAFNSWTRQTPWFIRIAAQGVWTHPNIHSLQLLSF